MIKYGCKLQFLNKLVHFRHEYRRLRHHIADLMLEVFTIVDAFQRPLVFYTREKHYHLKALMYQYPFLILFQFYLFTFNIINFFEIKMKKTFLNI